MDAPDPDPPLKLDGGAGAAVTKTAALVAVVVVVRGGRVRVRVLRLGAGEVQERGPRGPQRAQVERVRRRHVPARLHQLLGVPAARLAPRHRLQPLQPRLAAAHRTLPLRRPLV
jgi:hypothetical protein